MLLTVILQYKQIGWTCETIDLLKKKMQNVQQLKLADMASMFLNKKRAPFIQNVY